MDIKNLHVRLVLNKMLGRVNRLRDIPEPKIEGWIDNIPPDEVDWFEDELQQLVDEKILYRKVEGNTVYYGIRPGQEPAVVDILFVD